MKAIRSGLSRPEAAAFAAIARRLDDPERTRFSRISAAAGAAFLALAAAFLIAVVRWPWPAVATFAVTFALGFSLATSLVRRRFRPKPR